jgi:hypothetical protein
MERGENQFFYVSFYSALRVPKTWIGTVESLSFNVAMRRLPFKTIYVILCCPFFIYMHAFQPWKQETMWRRQKFGEVGATLMVEGLASRYKSK